MMFPLRRPDSALRIAGAAWRLSCCSVLWLLSFPGLAQTAVKPPAPQADEPLATSSSDDASEVPGVPRLAGFLHGVNAGVTFSGIHDAQTGWAVLSQPAIGYSFNDVFSLDVTLPIYNYRLAESRATKPKPGAQLVALRAELGDVVVAVHAQLLPPQLEYQLTVSATAPTGDVYYGLSTGRATVDLSNHLQHEFRRVTPELELGIGDSSTLANQLVVRNYTSLGPLAHFQAGFAFPLVRGSSIEMNAYEQLPVGDQKIYESVTRRKTTTTVVVGRGVSEDNGFTTSLDLPIEGHATLSGYYNHSLRLHDDTVSFGASYVLRSAAAEQTLADDVIGRALSAGTSGLSPGAPLPQ
jgi:hypothetical protein